MAYGIIYKISNIINGKVYIGCAKDGAKSVNGDRSAVIKCCKGKQKHHKGFVWKYKEDYTSLEGVPECRT